MVTTVIPTYNRTRLLMERALPSVLAQGDVEAIVVGDGTEPATARAIRKLGDSRVRFWNRPRPDYPADPLARWRVAGLAAINFGLARATHEWVSILADDDAYRPEHHRALLAASHGADVVFGTSLSGMQAYGLKWPPDPLDIAQGSYIARRSVLPTIRPKVCTDGAWDGYFWRALIASGARFRHVDAWVHVIHRNPATVAFHGAAW